MGTILLIIAGIEVGSPDKDLGVYLFFAWGVVRFVLLFFKEPDSKERLLRPL